MEKDVEDGDLNEFTEYLNFYLKYGKYQIEYII
jgi:hypothetical protein